MKDDVDYHFKNRLQAGNLVQKICPSDKDSSVSVNPNLLFQRFAAILSSVKNNDNKVKSLILFTYSL